MGMPRGAIPHHRTTQHSRPSLVVNQTPVGHLAPDCSPSPPHLLAMRPAPPPPPTLKASALLLARGSNQQDLSSWRSGGWLCGAPPHTHTYRLECHPSRVTLILLQAGPSPLPGLTPEGGCCALLRATWKKRSRQGYGWRPQGTICTQAMPPMPFSTISIGEQREAEPAGKFWEDISEVVPARNPG